MDDWRIARDQESYLSGVWLTKKKYSKYRDGWEHDHCELCNATISELENDLNEGYATDDDYRWICETCYQDFKERFQWKLRNTADEP